MRINRIFPILYKILTHIACFHVIIISTIAVAISTRITTGVAATGIWQRRCRRWCTTSIATISPLIIRVRAHVPCGIIKVDR